MAVVESTKDQANIVLLPSEWVRERAGFVVTAKYLRSMDQLVFLDSDAHYRADRVDAYLTLFWAPDDDQKLVGLKLKGFGYLFESLKKLCAVGEDDFVPFVKWLELALVVSWPKLSTQLTAQRIIQRYEQAKDYVRDKEKDFKVADLNLSMLVASNPSIDATQGAPAPR